MKLDYYDLTTNTIYKIIGNKHKDWDGATFIVTGFCTSEGTSDHLMIESIKLPNDSITFEILYERSALADNCNFEEIGNKETYPEYFL